MHASALQSGWNKEAVQETTVRVVREALGSREGTGCVSYLQSDPAPSGVPGGHWKRPPPVCRHGGCAVEQQPRKRGCGQFHIQCPEPGLLRFAGSLLLLLVVFVFRLGLGSVGFEEKLHQILIFI